MAEIKARMTFPVHTYLKKLRENGAREEYIEKVRRHIIPLSGADLPVLLTLGHLAFALQMPYELLLGFVSRRIDPYRVFSIRKRNGKKRYICVPEAGLLTVQRWIHSKILCSKAASQLVTPNCTAYVSGGSHIKNASKHLGAPWIVKVDVTRFFESISERQVYRVFREIGYRAQVALCLTRLCTRILPPHVDRRLSHNTKRWHSKTAYKVLDTAVVGHLPQGAPTSPMLANLVCRNLDIELQKLAVEAGLTYTRYADDFTFSGEFSDKEAARVVIRKIAENLGRYGFGINHQKTTIAKNGARKIITGLSVQEDSIRLPRSFKDLIRQELYYIGKFGLQNHCSRVGIKNRLNYLLRLSGRIKYAMHIEPNFGKECSGKLLTAVPDYLNLEKIANFDPTDFATP